ncbi:hypothetical protein [Clostridium butyricum]|uniref:hypothetical protein n=1 Tax=Clostridium butyricum TaxID=1492 RepID=UPI002AAFDE07|nr:hypothetical protein [Clostridium butyricum]
MKKIKNIMAVAMTAIIIMAVSPVVANAEWRQDSTGWWYASGSSWYTGWKLIDGNWYYFYSNGYMAHDTTIDGRYLNSSGAWTENVYANDPNAIKEGTYKVGQDIQAGEYLVKCTSDFGGYYECTANGNFESVIFNGNVSKGSSDYITLKEGEYIKLQRCVMYTTANAPSIVPSDGIYKEGTYKVGKDIQAGEYLITSTNSDFDAYVEVSNDSRHNINNIVMNDNFKGNKYVTVEDGQYLTIARGQINTK